jgi:glutathione S-transferase
MSSGYRLYTFYRSSTAWRVRIALNLKKIKLEYTYVHILKGEQHDSKYKSINPNQGVPTLQLKDGTNLVESMAIIEYLDEAHPN